MAIIALNVVVQVVFDSIIFSYLQMDLHSASWVLTYLFIATCGGFIGACVLIFKPLLATTWAWACRGVGRWMGG